MRTCDDQDEVEDDDETNAFHCLSQHQNLVSILYLFLQITGEFLTSFQIHKTIIETGGEQ